MLTRFDWPDAGTLAKELAARIAAKLARHIASEGEAYLAVSGGQTPVRMFAALAAADLNWSKVTVTLVDERWVDETSPRSNAGLVKRHLLVGKAAAARFLPLYSTDHAPEAGWLAAELRLAYGAEELDRRCARHGRGWPHGLVFSWRRSAGCRARSRLDAPDRDHAGARRRRAADHPDIGNPAQGRLLALHIEGQAKQRVLEKALGDGPVAEMPVRAVLRQERVPVEIHWAR